MSEHITAETAIVAITRAIRQEFQDRGIPERYLDKLVSGRIGFDKFYLLIEHRLLRQLGKLNEYPKIGGEYGKYVPDGQPDILHVDATNGAFYTRNFTALKHALNKNFLRPKNKITLKFTNAHTPPEEPEQVSELRRQFGTCFWIGGDNPLVMVPSLSYRAAGEKELQPPAGTGPTHEAAFASLRETLRDAAGRKELYITLVSNTDPRVREHHPVTAVGDGFNYLRKLGMHIQGEGGKHEDTLTF
jgi:hypothetical protein